MKYTCHEAEKKSQDEGAFAEIPGSQYALARRVPTRWNFSLLADPFRLSIGVRVVSGGRCSFDSKWAVELFHE